MPLCEPRFPSKSRDSLPLVTRASLADACQTPDRPLPWRGPRGRRLEGAGGDRAQPEQSETAGRRAEREPERRPRDVPAGPGVEAAVRAGIARQRREEVV